MFKKYTKSTMDKPLSNEPVSEMARPHPLSSELRNYSFGEKITEALSEENTDDESEWEEPETVLGEKVSVKGTLTFQKLLRVDGTFEGELISEGKLIIGPTGSVKANIKLKEAYISGKIEGDITVTERLVLRGHAEVLGNITAPKLSVDEGVSIMGLVSVIAPKLTPETPVSQT
jgi:cytoskeletal protein CcmA (bactofilin family)